MSRVYRDNKKLSNSGELSSANNNKNINQLSNMGWEFHDLYTTKVDMLYINIISKDYVISYVEYMR